MTNQIELYTERLLSYWKLSLMRNLLDATYSVELIGSLCNDDIKMQAIIEDNCFKALEFTAQNCCCISQSSAAMLVEYFRGKTIEEVLIFTNQDMLNLVGIKVPPVREGCVLLSLECLRKICGQAKI
jgi:NifU-like protein involved in Fe-S cluster formation